MKFKEIANENMIRPQKKYITLTNAELIEDTESYFDQLSLLYTDIIQYENKIAELINNFLHSVPIEWDKIYQIIEMDEFQKMVKTSSDYEAIELMVKISMIESQMNLPISCNEYNNIEDLVKFYNKIIFKLRRIELSYDHDDDYLKFKNEISFIFIGQVIYYGNLFDKNKIYLKISKWLMENNMRSKAILILFYITKEFPTSDNSYLEFSNFLLEQGEIALGRDMLLQIKEPPEKIRELINILDAKVREQ